MRKEFNILIVEDELMIAEMTKEMLFELGYNVVGIAKNPFSAIKFLQESDKIDLVILDINLNEEKDGIDVGMKIQEKYKIPYIYLTSYSDPKTVKRASETTPSGYLLKPYTKGDLFTTIEIIRIRKLSKSPSIVVKDGEYSVKIHSSDISYIKSDNNYLELNTDKKIYIIRNSLDKFLEELNDSNFIRIHRSYAVNMLKVDAITGQYVIVGDEKCPLSRSHKQELMDSFAKD